MLIVDCRVAYPPNHETPGNRGRPQTEAALLSRAADEGLLLSLAPTLAVASDGVMGSITSGATLTSISRARASGVMADIASLTFLARPKLATNARCCVAKIIPAFAKKSQ